MNLSSIGRLADLVMFDKDILTIPDLRRVRMAIRRAKGATVEDVDGRSVDAPSRIIPKALSRFLNGPTTSDAVESAMKLARYAGPYPMPAFEGLSSPGDVGGLSSSRFKATGTIA